MLLASFEHLCAHFSTITIVIEDEAEPDGEAIAPAEDKRKSHLELLFHKLFFKFIFWENSALWAYRENAERGRLQTEYEINAKELHEKLSTWKHSLFPRFTLFPFVCF